MLEKMYQKAKDKELDIVVCNSINVYENNTQIEIKSNLKFFIFITL